MLCEFSKFYNKYNVTYRKHRIGHSVKGWTNGEIGVALIEESNRNTTRKVNGRYHLLLVTAIIPITHRGFLSMHALTKS